MISGDDNQPLAGANIVVAGKSLGTASNNEGKYILKLKAGLYRIIFSYIGYEPDTVTFSVEKGQTLRKDVVLKESSVLQKSIVVVGDKVNPAEQIILNVIENKRNYLQQLENYTYDAYTKTRIEVEKKDTSVIGGILEVLTKAYYKYPGEFQETIIGQRQTKNFTEATNLLTLGKIPNVLNNDIQIDEIAVTSPLSDNALSYYSYEMVDTSAWNGRRLFVISFTPKRSNIPLFRGKIKIVDGLYTVAEVELYGDELIKTSVRKNISITEKLRAYQNYFRLPVNVSLKFDLDMGLLMPVIRISQESVISNYVINDDEFSHEFDNSMVVTSISDVDKDELWDRSQVIPLTIDEIKAAARIDSIVTNAGLITRLILKAPGLMASSGDGMLTGLSDYYHYNKVEGHYLGLGISSGNFLEPVKISLGGGYGLSDKKWKAFSDIEYGFGKGSYAFAGYFDNLSTVDRFSRYSRTTVTIKSLLRKKDYDDYFYNRGWKAGINYKAADHLDVVLIGKSSKQESAARNTNWSLLRQSKEFRDNIKISEGQLSDAGISLRYDNRKYYDYGWIRKPVESKSYTVAEVSAVGSINKVLKSDYTYTIYHAFVNKYISTNYSQLNLAFIGGLLKGDKVIQNHFYLNGNFGLIADPLSIRTISGNYYLSDEYCALFFEENFRNLLFNLFNIPFLENSKYGLYIYTNYAYVKNDPRTFADIPLIAGGKENIWEAGCGISNLLGFLRVDFAWSLSKARYQDPFSFQILTNLEL